MPVWIHIERRGTWCILRSAHPGGRIGTLCCDALDYEPVAVATMPPVNPCPACARELAAGTKGSAVAVDIADMAEPEPSRATTRDLRGPSAEARDQLAKEWREIWTDAPPSRGRR